MSTHKYSIQYHTLDVCTRSIPVGQPLHRPMPVGPRLLIDVHLEKLQVQPVEVRNMGNKIHKVGQLYSS